MSTNDIKTVQYYLPFSTHIERFLISCLILFISCLIMAQIFILSGEENQAVVNKAIRYEGVFQEDPIEAKAALQRR
jgi:ABC-type uncharacterized transport system permease subunit